MPDGQQIPERVKSAEIARLTGFSKRKVQRLAEKGKIPSAARLGEGCWTFDLAAVRAWIRREESRQWQTTSTKEAVNGTPEFRSAVGTYDEAYEQLLRPKPRNGSPKH